MGFLQLAVPGETRETVLQGLSLVLRQPGGEQAALFYDDKRFLTSSNKTKSAPINSTTPLK